MTVSRWDPHRELVALRRQVGSLFDAALSRSSGDEDREAASATWTPPVDIVETAERVILRADLPGVAPQDIEVRIEDEMLTLRGERRIEAPERREDCLRIERSFGAFARTFTLPPGLDRGTVRALLRNGTLEISVEKRPPAAASPVRVEVP